MSSTLHAIYLPMLWHRHAPNTDFEVLKNTASSFLIASDESISLFNSGNTSLQEIEETSKQRMGGFFTSYCLKMYGP